MINLDPCQTEAILELDAAALRDAAETARAERGSSALSALQLHRLGSFVSTAEHRFLRALDDLKKAKSAENISRKTQAAIRAGWDLESAVDQMKARARQERQDGETFFVDDHISDPVVFRPEMSVSVSYRWRAAKEDDWTWGRITFRYTHVAKPRYGLANERRKLSKRQREKELQEEIQSGWYHLRDRALFSLRDFFREGGDGADIPEDFEVAADRDGLNKFSLVFWRRPDR